MEVPVSMEQRERKEDTPMLKLGFQEIRVLLDQRASKETSEPPVKIVGLPLRENLVDRDQQEKTELLEKQGTRGIRVHRVHKVHNTPVVVLVV